MTAPLYQSGNDVRIGDRVTLAGQPGVVVFVIDTGSYSPDFPEKEWAYLKSGFMLDVQGMGLVHETEADEDLELVARAA